MLKFDVKGEKELLKGLKAWELQKRARVMEALEAAAALTLEERWKRASPGRHRKAPLLGAPPPPRPVSR